MFSTKGVYRIAIIVEKNEAEPLIEELLSRGLVMLKDAKEYNGPFIGKKAREIITFSKIIKEKMPPHEEGKKCNAYTDEEIINYLEAVSEGKAIDYCKHKAAEELLAFANKLLECEKKAQKIGKSFVLIEGWISKNKLKAIEGLIEKREGVLEYVLPEEEERYGPIKLNNGGAFKAFEKITELYPPLKYGSIDITPIIAITFPFIFGLMFASALDGAILALVALYLIKKGKREFGVVLGVMAAASIFFGLLFGEVWISHSEALLPVYEKPMLLLYISIAVGVFHTGLGHIIALINAWKEREKRKAYFEHLGALLLILGGITYIAYQTAGLALGGVGLLLIVLGGSKSIAELPHVVGHIFSYARIFAISLSHYSISTAFYGLAVGFFAAKSIVGLIIGGIIVAIGHLILLTVELLIASIHTLRLHILEFGTKFVEQGFAWFSADEFKLKKIMLKKGLNIKSPMYKGE